MKKKILITGMNKAQCTRDFFLAQQLKIVPSHYSLVRCLEDMNYEVEQREVTIGEDLSAYEEIIFYIHSPQAFAQALYSGLWTLSQRQDAIIAFDDWQIDQIFTSLRAFRKSLLGDNDQNPFREYLLELQMTQNSPEFLSKYTQNYIEAIDIIQKGTNRMLASVFGGGDISLLNINWDQSKIYGFNPNPYHLNRTPNNNFGSDNRSLFSLEVSPEEKKMVWNFSSLVQNKTKTWLKKQDISKWEIMFYGSKRGEHKCERLTEDEMCKEYSKQWGCLMPGYFHSGSGWWRARPLQIADVGSILVGEKKELMVYYQDEYLSSLKASDVEAMDLTQLTQTAKAQRDAIYSVHPLDKEFQKTELRAVLEASQ